MKNSLKNKLTVLWYAHPRIAIALMLIVVNLVVIALFTAVLSIISGKSFFDELAYVFTFTMSADGVYDFVNAQEDVACFVLKIVLALIQMIIFSGALIGFTTDVLQTAIDKKLNSVGKITLKGHYVFLNWSSIGPRIIYDLSFLEGNKTVVILSDKDRDDVLTSIQNVFTENKRRMKNVRVFIKQGSPMSPKHLDEVSLEHAKYVGLMLSDLEDSGEHETSANDLNAIKTLFTMMNIGLNANIVVETEQDETIEKIESLLQIINPQLNNRIIAFSHNSVVGHILGRAVVNPTYNKVYHELLSYDGVEFYGVDVLDVETAMYTYDNCIPVINYDDDETEFMGVKRKDRLYVLSENASNLGERKELTKKVKPLDFAINNEREEFSVFIVSNDGNARFVIEELNKYACTCNTRIVYRTFLYGEGSERLIEELRQTGGNKKVLLLSAAESSGQNQDADVFLMALALKLNGGLDDKTQVYAEIFNPGNISALENLGVVSVIVSNILISLFMVQVLTHPGSKRFYRDLISLNDNADEDKIDVDVVKAKEVLRFDGALTFESKAELVQSFYLASNKSRICVGIRKEDEQSVTFLCNDMDKSENIVINENDELVLMVL